MEAGPIVGLTASMIVPTAATDRAQSPIFSVIAQVVFGLITLINIGRRRSSRGRHRCVENLPLLNEEGAGAADPSGPAASAV
jgi:hypothetical protein